MKNRYDDNIREANQTILDLTAGNVTLRLMLAFELLDKLKEKTDHKVIELGCGEGDLTHYLFKVIPNLEMEVLDVSAEMLSLAKTKLVNYRDKVRYMQSDANEHVKFVGNEQYDVIVSAWTIHNFIWDDKKEIFQQIFSSLKPGGTMLLMDKIYADDPVVSQSSYDSQIARYEKLNDLVREDMLAHELQDYSPEYKMSELQTKVTLESVGFKNFKIIDRIERDVVVSVQK